MKIIVRAKICPLTAMVGNGHDSEMAGKLSMSMMDVDGSLVSIYHRKWVIDYRDGYQRRKQGQRQGVHGVNI